MKKVTNSVFISENFYAVRANEFPHCWLKTYKLGRKKKAVLGVDCVDESDQFTLTKEGREAAESFAKENDGTVVFVVIETKKNFYQPPKLNK